MFVISSRVRITGIENYRGKFYLAFMYDRNISSKIKISCFLCYLIDLRVRKHFI